MRRLAYAILACVGLICLAQARPGPDSNYNLSAGGTPPSFSGSGDTVTGAYAYWSCGRAYTAAYATGAGNACDIIRASDSATCTTKFNSTGFLDVTTAYCGAQNVTAFCNATTCKVTKAYDQSGGLQCASAACDASQATGASQPVLNLSGLSSKVCMTFAGGQELDTVGITNAISQPLSGSFVAERTGTFTTFNSILGQNGVQFLFNSSANQGGIYAGNIGTNVQVAMSDSAYHALNMVANGSSSIVAVDGSASTGLTSGTNPISVATALAIGAGNNPLTGNVCEARLDAVGYNATQYGNLNTNQHSATSGWNF